MNTLNLSFPLILLISLFSCKNEQKELITSNQPDSIKEIIIDPYTIIGEHHFLNGYEAKTAEGNINVVVEIPTGSVDKWEVDKTDGSLKWQILEDGPRKVNYLGYPGNYGMIPKTYLPKDLGGDGDPLDVIVLGPAVKRGSIIECKIIGVIELLDRGEQDDKLIAVMKDTPFYLVNSIDELKQSFNGALDIVTTWFSNYKGPGKMEIQTVAEKERADEILEASIKAYKNANETH
ncbi:inorganic diphosphatase [Vicingus serpentipes]|uniref:inorganic diphosphatase n=1 Tax=Vicingus serpentipes TaxID=1926625 RepID=A0A5C6RWF6_9FLAO|nr:inorganic diphosphatase [Vicingus serpentipes]TXB66661.1 inorganic diphosphatase [Vicingus serpentipes]